MTKYTPFAPEIIAKFWEQVDKRGPDDCWEWRGYTKTVGYGALYLTGNQPIYTHRFSYILHNGPIPDGMCVCHSCDNRTCCNPAHLWLGTKWDNAQDRESKGRGGHTQGEQNGHSKLTADQVKEMRRLYEQGQSCTQIGKQFGVFKTTVNSIVNRRKWRHIP